MTLEELRTMYRANLLVEAIAEPLEEQGDWLIEFRHIQGGFVVLTHSNGETCHYSDLHYASQSAREVGFKQVRVESICH
ncbi:hypothetical protein ACXJY6_19105 [Vibrio sp. RC27]